MAAHTVVLLAILLFLPLLDKVALLFYIKGSYKSFPSWCFEFIYMGLSYHDAKLLNATSYSSTSVTQIKHEDR